MKGKWVQEEGRWLPLVVRGRNAGLESWQVQSIVMPFFLSLAFNKYYFAARTPARSKGKIAHFREICVGSRGSPNPMQTSMTEPWTIQRDCIKYNKYYSLFFVFWKLLWQKKSEGARHVLNGHFSSFCVRFKIKCWLNRQNNVLLTCIVTKKAEWLKINLWVYIGICQILSLTNNINSFVSPYNYYYSVWVKWNRIWVQMREASFLAQWHLQGLSGVWWHCGRNLWMYSSSPFRGFTLPERWFIEFVLPFLCWSC